jgi:hypothetical protein
MNSRGLRDNSVFCAALLRFGTFAGIAFDWREPWKDIGGFGRITSSGLEALHGRVRV